MDRCAAKKCLTVRNRKAARTLNLAGFIFAEVILPRLRHSTIEHKTSPMSLFDVDWPAINRLYGSGEAIPNPPPHSEQSGVPFRIAPRTILNNSSESVG